MNETLVADVMRLKPAERLRLLEVIHDSLDRPDDEIDEAWYDEAQRRLAAVKSGKSRGTPAQGVIGDRP